MKLFRYKIICWIALLLLQGVHFLQSQSGDTPILLPGHKQSESALVKSSTNIAVAVFVARGKIEIGPPGVLNYSDSKIRIEENLKGAASGEVNCIFDLLEAPESEAERQPSIGSRYIIFMQGRDPHVVMRVLSFLEFSDERLAKIKKLLNTEPEH